ncbi:hypothetical protein BP6252_00679 [Coleophoma cylindrospora]|uniref:ATPase AAA-type core domain-containing protein n=1 Tax=Coleophoma cylindrospora TaxID=1849047 RepID=A0A3D8SQS2_9HELO|nr:hypothetical protein BP6252_00679 [Coleophoma cylindrospora]
MGRAEHEPTSLHPFFTKPIRGCPESTVKDDIPDSAAVTAAEPNSKSTTDKCKKTAAARKDNDGTAATSPASAAMLEVDPNTGRRKRIKTSLESREDMGGAYGEGVLLQLTEEANKQEIDRDEEKTPRKVDANLDTAATTGMVTSASERLRSPASVERHAIVSIEVDPFLHKSASGPIAQPDSNKKVLRLNRKTGTIGSPPAKKSTTANASRPRGRKPKSQIVLMQYGNDQESRLRIGTRINQIMESAKAVCSSNMGTCGPTKSDSTSKPPHSLSSKKEVTQKSKTTHPFFSGKTGESSIPAPERPGPVERPKLSMVSGRGRPPQALSKDSMAFAGFGKTERLFKFPGAMEPAWPWEGMQHIRGHSQHSPRYEDSPLPPTHKKSKGQAVEILHHEDILNVSAASLNIAVIAQSINDINADGFKEPSSCLRIPRKHIETGSTLQRRVRKELHARFQATSAEIGESSEEDEIQTANRHSTTHAALQMLYASIATSLSPFDRSQCETQAWTAKYAPKQAIEVLQMGREPVILKEWLQSLTILAVDRGATEAQSRATTTAQKRSAMSKSDTPAKRKRKSKKLDDFIVSDDDDEMDEIVQPDEIDSPRVSHGLPKKTLVRTYNGKEPRKLANAVLISGPHGSGKTATVYAVAKELGFEVFEINASSRRSGKDILEKVGDMTRNHLVQSSSAATDGNAFEDDIKQISDSLAADLKSGRQGTMNSFFKPKPPVQHNLVNPKPTENKEEVTGKIGVKTTPKQQRQSLILLEEVDILYEEDKQFWATVMPLITSSKRPLIMTCTDEAALPLQGLWPQLHAILRYSATPMDLAVDHMLLVAANEGHALQRSAIEALYEGRRFDLRASLTDLDFWCQLTVGDRKGGLEWFYPRWPPGCDVDENGNTLRIISQDTYQAGMGWLSQDYLKSQAHCLDVEEEILREAWDGWNLDIGDWQQTPDISSWAEDRRKLSSGRKDDYAALSIYEDFADMLSVSDICSAGAFSTINQIPLDTDLPKLSAKTKDDYVLAWGLLEAHPKVTYDRLGADLSTWMKSRARNRLQGEAHVKHGLEVPLELGSPSEQCTINLIREHSIYVNPSLTRFDFSLAFDPIATLEKKYVWSSNNNTLEASCFDRTMSLIVHDVAPFVRSIVAYDAKLLNERTRLSNLLSEGGGVPKGKRMRTTRSALSALEGGTRKTTRKEKYFDAEDLNPHFVLATGSSAWQAAAAAELEYAQTELESLCETSTREVSEEGDPQANTLNDELQDE